MNQHFWETDRIRLRGIEPGDWEVHYHWNMNSDMMLNVDQLHLPTSKTHVKQWAEESSKQSGNPEQANLVIELLATETQIGSISPRIIDKRSGVFKYGVAILRDYQRNGYATEAILLVMRYFFDELRYQKCHVDIHGWNTSSVRLHEKMGFIKEGQLRRQIYAQGEYHDLLIYGITIEEFRERYD